MNTNSVKQRIAAGVLRKVSIPAKNKLRDKGVSVWWEPEIEMWVAFTSEISIANEANKPLLHITYWNSNNVLHFCTSDGRSGSNPCKESETETTIQKILTSIGAVEGSYTLERI